MINKKLQNLEFQVFLGIELEFYSTFPKEHFFFEEVLIKNEIGEGQFEAVFQFSSNILKVLKSAIVFRNRFKKFANFDAYFNRNQPSSALQFNLSFKQNGEFLNPEIFANSILQETEKNIFAFAPFENCKKRLQDLEKIKEFRNSPFTLSIGGANNRTTAIRIVNERLEHRIPSSNCQILKSFSAILNGILNALDKKNVEIPLILHSNAFEEEIINQFNLKKIL